MMSGIVKNYRRGINNTRPNQIVVNLNDIDSRAKAMTLKGRTALWKSKSGKVRQGKVTSAHGGNGAVRVRFEKGVPAEIIGSRIQIK